MKDFIKNIESYKVYNIIVITTISFIILSINSFHYISNQLKNLAEQNRVLMIKDIQHVTALWLLERVTSIENSAKFLDGIYDNEQTMQKFGAIISKNKADFDAIQILIPGKYFYVNDKKMDDYVGRYTYEGGQKRMFKEYEEYWYEKQEWFVKAKENMKTTINKVENQQFFHEKTVNICTPISRNSVFKGVLCGIIKANSLLSRIDELEIPKGGYYFISDSSGNVLASFGKVAFSEKYIKHIFSTEFIDESAVMRDINVDNNVITTYKFKDFDWYISVGMDENEVRNNESIQTFFKRVNLMLLFFILFVVVVNGAYVLLNARTIAKKKEYENILAYNSRMSEVGELISGINHQLRQPLNSLSLIISGTLELLSKKSVDIKTVISNLQLSSHSIGLMNKTIDIFRNFYRYDDAISEFYLKDVVDGVLCVMDTNLQRNNITVNIDNSNIEGLKVVSIENFIQQILLVLIQNAQDALGTMKSIKEIDKRKIGINFEVEKQDVKINICDYGCGIKKENERSLFSMLYKSQKKHGFGMGLFFAKKLANEKLKGDVSLANNANPTIFRFTIKKNLKDM